ncbi:hypothetical protein GCM10011514_00380 [Emticicia aquatilis]|uniref:Uncharacterized protein n=1 Tax=Emticicia aquatilis TaxID=1537369 RepID=A0A916YEG9_9BACT|nr:hypothetical protein GCM10011514_00380 [Emticicia aquatilis]
MSEKPMSSAMIMMIFGRDGEILDELKEINPNKVMIINDVIKCHFFFILIEF